MRFRGVTACRVERPGQARFPKRSPLGYPWDVTLSAEERAEKVSRKGGRSESANASHRAPETNVNDGALFFYAISENQRKNNKAKIIKELEALNKNPRFAKKKVINPQIIIKLKNMVKTQRA